MRQNFFSFLKIVTIHTPLSLHKEHAHCFLMSQSTTSSTVQKYVLSPQTMDPSIMDFYYKMEASFWTVGEVDLASDLDDWENKLTTDERTFIKHILAFFVSADGVVGENALTRFLVEFERADIRCVYGFQGMIENVHNLMYSALITSLVKDMNEAEKMFCAIEEMPCVAFKTKWAMRWLNSSSPLAERLVAFACTEGIFFSASFCAIFWIKKRALMPGLTFSNELISRDEGLHCDFACHLYKKGFASTTSGGSTPTHKNMKIAEMTEDAMDEHVEDATGHSHSKTAGKLSDERVHEIVSEAVEVESGFVKEALRVKLIGMNDEQMIQYVKFCADRLLTELGHPPLYNVALPFPWMQNISMQRKTNFFESRVSEYQKSGSMNRTEALNRKLVIQHDF